MQLFARCSAGARYGQHAAAVPALAQSGAGAATQRAVAMSVFGGMIAASFLGIFLIPGLYFVFQTFRERARSIVSGRSDTVSEPGE